MSDEKSESESPFNRDEPREVPGAPLEARVSAFETLPSRGTGSAIRIFALSATAIGLAAASRAAQAPQHFDVGGYEVSVVLDGDWRPKIDQQKGYIVLTRGGGEDSQGELAILGVFRVAIPLAVRGLDKVQIGSAYAIQDAAGVRKALFGSVTELKLLSHRPRAFHDGLLFECDEPIDLVGGRARSTKFVRAYVFYPASYADDGGLFLLVGLQQFWHPEGRAEEIDKLEKIAADLHFIARQK